MARIGETSVWNADLSEGLRHQRVVAVLKPVQRGAVHNQRGGIGALNLDGAQHQAFYRVGHVMGLVDHVRGAKGVALLQFRLDQFVED